MQTSVTFKRIDPSEPLKDYARDKLDRLDKYLYNPAEASVVLTVEKFRHIAEVNIAGDGLKINGREETDSMYSAIDMVMDKLEKQIKKSKAKNRSHRTGTKTRPMDTLVRPVMPEENINGEVHITNIEYKPMDVEEAILQLNLVDDNFLVFTNARTDRVNVLYHRNDGDYGLIQPNS
jgi:putative sigma-54 modulation protein